MSFSEQVNLGIEKGDNLFSFIFWPAEGLKTVPAGGWQAACPKQSILLHGVYFG